MSQSQVLIRFSVAAVTLLANAWRIAADPLSEIGLLEKKRFLEPVDVKVRGKLHRHIHERSEREKNINVCLP